MCWQEAVSTGVDGTEPSCRAQRHHPQVRRGLAYWWAGRSDLCKEEKSTRASKPRKALLSTGCGLGAPHQEANAQHTLVQLGESCQSCHKLQLPLGTSAERPRARKALCSGGESDPRDLRTSVLSFLGPPLLPRTSPLPG